MLRVSSLLVISVILAVPVLSGAADKGFIIGFRPEAGVTMHEKKEKVQMAGGRIKRQHDVVNAISAQLSVEQAAILGQDPRVAYVEEDRVFSVPQPEIVSPEYANSWGVARIGSELAAGNGIKGAGVKVAVLDTGIDYNHPDLIENYRGGYNFVDDTGDPYDDSRFGHGTHIAGIIAARGNGAGVVGVAPEASIYAVKVLNGGMMGSTSDIVSGIEWAVTHEMNVVSMSFGMPYDPLFFSQAVKDACDKAHEAGIVLIAAAGNGNRLGVDYPAAFEPVIAVAATMKDDSRYQVSNYGPKVEVAAPGGEIYSTMPGGGYGVMSGTSQAAPHAAGVAALLLSSGVVGEDAVRSSLAAGSEDLGAVGRDDYFGFGLVRAVPFLALTRSHASPVDDALSIMVKPGIHTLHIVNKGLSHLQIKTSSGVTDSIPLARYSNRTDKSQALNLTYSADQSTTLTFIPAGKRGSSAVIGIFGQ